MTTETERVGYTESSTLVGLARRVVNQLQRWIAASWLARTGETLASELATAADASTLANTVRTLARWTRHSFCYRWLTKEPDPDVVVIDLRETWTVGPFIALLDRIAPGLERTWRASLVWRVTDRIRNSSKQKWIAESRTVQLLQAALEPPDLPDDENRR